jgi:betaine lipid synthase
MEAPIIQRLRSFQALETESSLLLLAVFAAIALLLAQLTKSVEFADLGLSPYLKFVYANFLKPHKSKTSDGQQSALESFYATQVGENVT